MKLIIGLAISIYLLGVHHDVSAASNTVSFPFVNSERELLEFLQANHTEYIQAIKDGKSLAEFAEQHGVHENKLVHFLVKQELKELKQELKQKKIDKNMYDEIVKDLRQDIYLDIHKTFTELQ